MSLIYSCSQIFRVCGQNVSFKPVPVELRSGGFFNRGKASNADNFHQPALTRETDVTSKTEIDGYQALGVPEL